MLEGAWAAEVMRVGARQAPQGARVAPPPLQNPQVILGGLHAVRARARAGEPPYTGWPTDEAGLGERVRETVELLVREHIAAGLQKPPGLGWLMAHDAWQLTRKVSALERILAVAADRQAEAARAAQRAGAEKQANWDRYIANEPARDSAGDRQPPMTDAQWYEAVQRWRGHRGEARETFEAWRLRRYDEMQAKRALLGQGHEPLDAWLRREEAADVQRRARAGAGADGGVKEGGPSPSK